MATIAQQTYKDEQGIVQTINIDLDYLTHIEDIPEGHAFSIKLTDDQEETETYDFIGPSLKKN